MLDLSAVTLVCIDCAQPALALAAMEQTLNRARFAEALFVTDRDPGIDVLRTLTVPPLAGRAARLRFIARELAPRVSTPHALVIQWDAFPVNAAAWDARFLEYDWVAPEARADMADPSDNEGIALASRRLLENLRDIEPAEDDALHDVVARVFERGGAANALRRAPPALCQRFAFGDDPPRGQPFAFQGLFNMWMFFQPADLDAFLAMATPAILAAPSLAALAVNLRDLGRIAEADAIRNAMLRAHPGHPLALRLGGAVGSSVALPAAATAGVSAMTGAKAVGRNDPCPCGSGRKYKQCHGQLGAAVPAMAVTPRVAAANTGPAPSGIPLRPRGRGTVLFHRARLAFDRNELVEAERLYREILADDPDQPVALEYLGVLATRVRKYDDAEPMLRRALALDPHAPEFHNNLGLFHHARGEFAEAAACYARALELAPEYAPAHNNRGLALQEMGRLADAIAAYRRATELAPAFAEAHWNLGLALLLDGRYDEGLIEHEWRLQVEKDRAHWARRRQFPEWRGESLEGKRILVLAEQGLGDLIQFARYAAPLAARGATVVLETAPALIDLLRTVPGVTEVAPLDGPYPPCDLQVPLMSLPLRFNTRPGTLPLPRRYLSTESPRVARWEGLLGPRTKPRVGITWAGNPEQARDRYRSIPLARFAPLLADPDIEWIAVQKGAAAEQIAALPPESRVRDMGRYSDTFADLAALVELLDVVITVDTSVVHVSGALGRPTLLLLNAGHDWRWPRTGHTGGWYPSVRIVRQPAGGDWDGAIREAAALVREMTAPGTRSASGPAV